MTRRESELLADLEAKIAQNPEPSAQTLYDVRGEVDRVRKNARNPTVITKMDVIDGILDGIRIARTMADAGNVIKGWVEISKILGLQAPEVKKIELTTSQARLRSKFEALSDEELLAVAEGKNIIEGEVSG